MSEGASWSVVAILCSVILGLFGSLMAMVLSRFAAQSKKTGDLTKLVHDMNGAARERAARNEARIETVRETLSARLADLDTYYRHNIPELFAKWEQHCLEDRKGKPT